MPHEIFWGESPFSQVLPIQRNYNLMAFQPGLEWWRRLGAERQNGMVTGDFSKGCPQAVTSPKLLSFPDGVQRASLQLPQKKQLWQQLLHRITKWWVHAVTAAWNMETGSQCSHAFSASSCLADLTWAERRNCLFSQRAVDASSSRCICKYGSML